MRKVRRAAGLTRMARGRQRDGYAERSLVVHGARLLSNSAMRVCHPGPLAFQRASVSAGKRKVVDARVGRLLGPRMRRSVSFSRSSGSEWMTTAPFQSAAVVGGFSASSTGASGAAASAAARSEGSGRFVEVAVCFMFVPVSAGNQVRPGAAIRPDQYHDAIVSPAQAFQPQLATGFALVFNGYQGEIEHAFAFGQVDGVPGALDLTVSDHWQTVVTARTEVKQIVTTQVGSLHAPARRADRRIFPL